MRISVLVLLVFGLVSTQVFAKNKQTFEVLSPFSYSKLDKKSQKKYTKKIQSVWMNFEKKYKVPRSKKSAFLSLLIESAYADDQKCIIGGSVLTAGNSGGRTFCPTTNRPCSGQDDGFECGDIFGKVCISRTPISNLSQRCFNASQALSTEEYQLAVQALETDFNALCSGTIASVTKDGCNYLAKKLTAATQEQHQSNPNFAGIQISECTNGEDHGTRRPLWAPQFNLLSQNFCTFDSNRSILTQLTPQNCRGAQTQNLFTTRIQTKNRVLLHDQADVVSGIIDRVDTIERTGADNSTFAVRMVKHDISRSPIAPTVTTYTIRQRGSKYFLIESSGVEREVDITNTFRENFLVENFTSRYPSRVFETKTFLADNCRLASNLQTLRQSGAYTPESGGASSESASGSR